MCIVWFALPNNAKELRFNFYTNYVGCEGGPLPNMLHNPAGAELPWSRDFLKKL